MCIELHQTIAASREQIWTACATPEGLSGWQADEVSGEVRPGARVTFQWSALGVTLPLEVRECIHGERLVLGSHGTTVELIVRDGSLVLRHQGLGGAGDPEGLASSWRMALATLAHGLEEHPGRPRHVQWFFRPVRTDARVVHVFFTDANALRVWLTTSGGVGEEGDPLDLTLADGSRMSGRVRARVPNRDVALTWTEQQDSLIVFRTLPSPTAAHLRLVTATWSCWDAPPDADVAAFLDAALRRLEQALARGGTD